MKDLVLTDVNNAAVATFRAEMLTNTPANIEILEIRNSEGQQVDNLLIGDMAWQKLNYGWNQLVEFCTENNLKISAADSNGSNSAVLLGNQVPAGTKYTVVSGNGATKTLVVATDVTGDFAAGDVLKVYNSDNTLYGTFTHVSDAYGAPNTSIVVAEAFANIGADSGKFIINEGQ